ncbi:MAG: YCF48-related protein [Phycisphaerales bacterium]|nr:YCF48-related protein [Phycisphaerales bacterium]
MKKTLFTIIAFTCLHVANAQNWTILSSGTTSNLKSVHFPTTSVGYATGDNGTILKTVNGGTSWVNVASSYTGYWFWDVHFISADTGFVCGESNPGTNPAGAGIFLKTYNGGTTWTTCIPSAAFPIRDMFVLSKDTIIACGGAEMTDGKIVKSVDGGSTWTQIGSTYYDGMLGGLYFSNSTKGFLGLYESVFGTFNPTHSSWLSTTTGSTFSTTVSSAKGYWNFSTDFPSTSTGYMMRSTYVGTDTVYIRKTIDGGSNWTETAVPSYLGSIYGLDFVNNNTGYIVGGAGVIKKTIDGGTTWNTQVSGTTEELRSVYFVNTNLGFAVGNNGKILKWIAPSGIENKFLSNEEINIYPNPSSGAITITLPTDNAEINITDVLGQQVMSIQTTHKSTNLQLDLNGIYFAYIKTKQGIATRTLIVNR